MAIGIGPVETAAQPETSTNPRQRERGGPRPSKRAAERRKAWGARRRSEIHALTRVLSLSGRSWAAGTVHVTLACVSQWIG